MVTRLLTTCSSHLPARSHISGPPESPCNWKCSRCTTTVIDFQMEKYTTHLARVDATLRVAGAHHRRRVHATLNRSGVLFIGCDY